MPLPFVVKKDGKIHKRKNVRMGKNSQKLCKMHKKTYILKNKMLK